MKEVSLSGAPRAYVGKKDAKAVRNAGNVPAVIYGGDDQLHISLSHVELEKLIYTPDVNIINVDVDGQTRKTLIQDIQFHPVTDRIQHVDFIELRDDRKVKIDIPVVLEGRAIGVINGGKLSQVFRKLKVYAYPGDLPDAITVDISKLRIGQVIRVGDLIKDGLNILNPPSAVVVSIKTARGVIEEEEEEEEEGAEGEEGTEGGEEGGGEAAPAEEGGEG